MMRLSKPIIVIMLILVFVNLGYIRMWVWQRAQIDIQVPVSGVVTEKRISSKGQRVWVIQDFLSGKDVFVYTTFQPEFSYGDVLLVDGKLNENRIFYPSMVERSESMNTNLFHRYLAVIKEKISETVIRIFNERDAQLVMGVVFGFNEGIDPAFADRLKVAGIMHVIVASGYNVSIIVGFFEKITAFTGRKIMLTFTLLALIFYAGLSGFNPPIVRASIMGVVGLVALISGRPKDTILWLFYTAILMIFIDPSIVYSLSFQLSFGATFGIVVFAEKFNKILGILPAVFREATATSLAAQICTLPLIAIYFGILNPLSVLVNALILWTIPLIMFGGVVAVVVGMFNTPLGLIAALPIGLVLWYFSAVVNLFS